MDRTLMEKKEHLLLVPYQGKKGNYVIKSMKKRIQTLLPICIVTKTAYVGNKLSTCFRVQDITEFKHNLPRQMSRYWL